MSEQDSKQDFLSRWSERKSAARQGQPLSEPVREPDGAMAAEGRADVRADAPPPPELPDLDTLDENSDYSVFFSEGVGEELRRLALRKLFHAPSFNVTDGLDDYAEDFRNFKALGDIVTADMKHAIEMAEERRQRRLAEAGALDDAETASDSGVIASESASEPDVLAEDVPEASGEPDGGNNNDEESDTRHG